MSAPTLSEIVNKWGGLIQTGPFGSQLHQHDYSEQGTPVVMPKDICNGRVDESGIARIPESKASQLSRHFLKTGSVVFPRRGEISKCAYIREEQAGFLCGTGCIKIEPPEEKLRSKFLFYYLGLRQSVEWLERNAVGTTMLNLNTKILGGLKVPILPPESQDKIVDILSAYDDLIENNRRRIQLLEQAARLLYKEWFVHLRFPGHEHTKIIDGVPEGWVKKVLGDVCLEVRETVSPSALEGNTPYIGLEHMPRRSITLCEWGQTEQVTSSKHRFREGEILFGKIRPYFHKVGIALTDGVASSDAIIIRPANPHLLALVLMTTSSDGFVAVTAQQMKEGSKMPRADWKQMQQYPVPLPPDGLLSAFNDFIDSILNHLKTLAFANKRLSAARDLLLPKLMNGEVAV